MILVCFSEVSGGYTTRDYEESDTNMLLAYRGDDAMAGTIQWVYNGVEYLSEFPSVSLPTGLRFIHELQL